MIPPEANASFVAAMEDVLEVYQRPHDPARPVVCLETVQNVGGQAALRNGRRAQRSATA